tara:strand:- start:1687 stop:2118 length:432 start_codon:yes stop_codon:yes gene_type:complete
MRSVTLCLAALLILVSVSESNAQCRQLNSVRSLGASNVVVVQPFVSQPFVSQQFVSQQFVVPQSTSFFAGGNVAFLNAPAAVIGQQAFVVQNHQRANQRSGLFSNLFSGRQNVVRQPRAQNIIVRQPRAQNIIVGNSKLLIIR